MSVLLKKEIITITGQSGCGKSTTLNILGTLDSPDIGNIIIENKFIVVIKFVCSWVFISVKIRILVSAYRVSIIFCSIMVFSWQERRFHSQAQPFTKICSHPSRLNTILSIELYIWVKIVRCFIGIMTICNNYFLSTLIYKRFDIIYICIRSRV